jgi:hypothetical protein
MLSLYTYTFLALAEEVLIYPLKLLWGVTLVNLVLQTTPPKKSQGVRLGERPSQVPQLIILSSTSDKACIDIRAVWAVAQSCRNQR